MMKIFLILAAIAVAANAQDEVEHPTENVSFCGEVPEGTTLSPTCPGDTVIVDIEFASYGLPTACPEPTINETCHSENTLTTVQQTCIGRNMCVLTATNDFFSDDPCAGTFKALTVAWTCGSAIDNEFCVTAKENTEMNILCPIGTVISNQYGFIDYGLPEPCPIAASNANCTLVDEATQQISDTCTLRNSCSFNVTNEFFGSDPCIDTEKRAVVQYSCTAAPATPQLNTALLFSTLAQPGGVATGYAGSVNGTDAWCFNATLRDAATLLTVGDGQSCFLLPATEEAGGSFVFQRQTTLQFADGAIRVLNNVQTVSTDPISSGVCAGAPATHLTSTCVPVGEIANQYVEIPAEETDFNAGFFQGVEGAMGIKGAVNMTMFDPATIPAGDVGFDEIYLVRTFAPPASTSDDDAVVEAE